MIDLLHGLIKVVAEVATTVADIAVTCVDNAKSLDVVLDNIKKEKEEKSVVSETDLKSPIPETTEKPKTVDEELTDKEDVLIGPSNCTSDDLSNSKLKQYLINSLWSLPQLLLHYGITQRDINEVVSPFDQALLKTTGHYIDAATLQLVYNCLQENYPLHELVKMGIYTGDGLLKINPVDVLYAKKEKSPAELAEIELMNQEIEEFKEIIKSNVDNDEDIKDVQKYTAILAASNPQLSSVDITYITELLNGLEPETQNEIKKYIDSKKNRL